VTAVTVESSASAKEPEALEPVRRHGVKPMSPRADRYAQMVVLTLLLAGPAFMCLHAAIAIDPDLWWHLRVGEWVSQHHAVPHVDPFSRELAGKPWFAYSWLYELLMFKIQQRFGLMGMVGYSTAMVLAITVAFSHMVRRLQSDFTVSTLLTFGACFSMAHLYTPRPWMFSILFFVIELDILLNARRTGRLRSLVWLPLIFALWANLHIEFIYGLFAVGVAFLESLIARWRKSTDVAIPLFAIASAMTASLLATLANPFGWRIYSVVYSAATDSAALKLVSEMQAIPFRDLADYSLLALALTSVAALAWSRRFRVFETSLLLFAIFMSFREQRDAWLLSAVAAALLAAAIPAGNNLASVRLPRFSGLLATAGAVCILMVTPRVLKLNNAVLKTRLAATFPVDAVQTIQARGYSGPVFNDFNWGGYMIWSLRQPVTIDGRTNLYGNERIDRSVATWAAHKDWADDAELKSAGLVIGPVQSPLIQLLRMDPHFQLVYEDKVAAVFLHHNS